MRNLVITRHKSLGGKAAVLGVYVADPAGEHTIKGTPCRWLGSLANGETAAFAIGEGEEKIYVTASGSNKLPCEYCIVPPGTADVFLSGKCLRRPAEGDLFHFDGNTQPKRKRWGWILAAVCLVLFLGAFLAVSRLLPGFLRKEVTYAPKVFTAEGMQLTLTEGFRQTDVAEYGFTVGYAGGDTAIYILKEEFALSEGFGELTLEAYAHLVIGNNRNLYGKTVQQEKGLTILEYTNYNSKEQQTYSYLVAFYKGPDAFWMVEFTTPLDKADQMRQTYLDYAATVCFPAAAI